MRTLLLAATLCSAACGGSTADPPSSPTTSSGNPTVSSSSGTSTSSSGATDTTSSSSSSTSSTSSTSGGPPQAINDVSGKWQGKAGGDSTFLDLTQLGAAVTGSACEGPGKDCYVVHAAKNVDRRLTGTYSWEENDKTETVTLDLTLSGDGKRLDGEYVVTKCNCTLKASLDKQ